MRMLGLAALAVLVMVRSTQGEEEGVREDYVRRVKTYWEDCKRAPWACAPACRSSAFYNDTGRCLPPTKRDTCFGAPIQTSFVRNGSEDDRLRTLEGLQFFRLFPRCGYCGKAFYGECGNDEDSRCWKDLSPLLCASVFRPCTSLSMEKETGGDEHKEQAVEVWQRLPRRMCEYALKACAWAVERRIFPHVLTKCPALELMSLGRTRSSVFYDIPSRECTVRYDMPLQEEVMCPRPLIYISKDDEDNKGRPNERMRIVDQCFLPCRSHRMPWYTQVTYRIATAAMGGCFVIGFVGVFLCTIYVSKEFERKETVYVAAMTLPPATVHLLIWTLGALVEPLANAVMCDNLYPEIRATEMTPCLNWCAMEALILHVTGLAAHFWLALLTYILIAKPQFKHDTGLQEKATVSLRVVFALVVYAPATAIGVFALFLNMREVDGVTGVCAIGLWDTNAGLIFTKYPVLFAFAAACLLADWKRRTTRDIEWSSTEALCEESRGGLIEAYRIPIFVLTIFTTVASGVAHWIWIGENQGDETKALRNAIRCLVNMSLTKSVDGVQTVLRGASLYNENLLGLCGAAMEREEKAPLLTVVHVLLPALPLVLTAIALLHSTIREKRTEEQDVVVVEVRGPARENESERTTDEGTMELVEENEPFGSSSLSSSSRLARSLPEVSDSRPHEHVRRLSMDRYKQHRQARRVRRVPVRGSEEEESEEGDVDSSQFSNKACFESETILMKCREYERQIEELTRLLEQQVGNVDLSLSTLQGYQNVLRATRRDVAVLIDRLGPEVEQGVREALEQRLREIDRHLPSTSGN